MQVNLRQWQAGIGAIALLMLGWGEGAIAQIQGDNTLGTQVNGNLTTPCMGTCIITNGATRGSNLFHSFQQFSLPNGDFAGFVTTPTIQNVIVRVTGVGQPFISNINGTIATVNPTVTAINPANFFLINPNGIVFGPNASLLVGGSFLATTAERMQFRDGTQFSTTDPAPLLTISVPIGLQMGRSPGTIQSRMRIGAGINSLFTDFALVGGDVTLNNSVIQAPGQRVELGSMGENGTVGLQLNGDRLSLSFPVDTRRDIALTDGSIIRTLASNGGGDIILAGRNITFDNNSFLFAGIEVGIDNSAVNRAGDLTINATNDLELSGNSGISNLVLTNATGQAGNVIVAATNLIIRDGSQIISNTFGNGAAGDVRVTANTIALNGTDPNGQDPSAIGSEIGSTGIGSGGNVTVKTDSLRLTNGAVISASTFGTGDAGNVGVTANTIVMDGTIPNGQKASGIFSTTQGTGSGGNVTVDAGSFRITNGAVISANTVGNGNGGNVKVMANTIDLDGTAPNGQSGSGIGSQVGLTGSGQGGDVTVETGLLNVTNGALVSASTFGNGNAGNLRVTANTIAVDGIASQIGSEVKLTGNGRGGNVTVESGFLTVTNGATISASTLGNGNAGNVWVTANVIALDATTPNGQRVSGIGSEVGLTGSGRGGNVAIETGSLTVTKGAVISASTFGIGDAGNVTVSADEIVLDGTFPDGQFSSGIGSQVANTGVGKGGNVNVQTGSLTITNGAAVSSSTFGRGDGGNLRIIANAIVLDGVAPNQAPSGIGSGVGLTATGKGGDVRIITNSLSISNGAAVTSSALGNGRAGNLDITSRNIRLDRGSITAASVSDDGANITLNVRDFLLLRYGSQISTTAGSDQFGGNGGNITISAPNGFIVGVKVENSDITANAFTGSGGRVDITAQGIYGLQFRPKLTQFSDITASSTFGFNGKVTLNTPDVDPSRGLAPLAIALVDPSQLIVQTCVPRGAQRASSFVTTGRGGVPSSPLEPLQDETVLSSWVTATDSGSNRANAPSPSSSQTPEQIVEAQGWIRHRDGTIELVANVPTSEPHTPMVMPVSCP